MTTPAAPPLVASAAMFSLAWPVLAAAQAKPANVVPQPAAIDGAVAHVYKRTGGAELRLHVFSPPRAAPDKRLPAIVFFFGGGWQQGLVTQFVPQARHLAARGMVAMVADYRVFTRHGTTPFESVADAKSAICLPRRVRPGADRSSAT
jgi:acetyl esterase/lipase